MTKDEERLVTTAVVEVTSGWARANCARDPDLMMCMFRDSYKLRFAENGIVFPSFDKYKEFVEDFYSNTVDMLLEWKRRDILPISPSAAVLTGVFDYHATQKSGATLHGRNVFTGVFICGQSGWQVIHGHESSGSATK